MANTTSNPTKVYSLSSFYNPGGLTSENVFSMSENLMDRYKFYSQSTSKQNMLWVYDELTGIWNKTAEDLIRAKVSEVLSDGYSTHLVNEIVNYIKAMSYKQDVTLGGDENKIVCENGTLNMTTGKFSKKYFPEEYHISRIPVSFDKKAKCPNFLKFLDNVTSSSDDKEAIIEFIGYCLFKVYVYEIIVLLVGEGANGKSILLSVIKSFLDSKNITSVSPQQLEKSTFASAQLHGKLACIAGDIPALPLKYTGYIKMVTGGDSINAEHKNQGAFDFVNYAKLIFSANQVPESWDASDAFFRRFRIIEFPNQFTPTDKNFIPRDTLLNSILSEEEKSGILNLAIEGLKKLRNQSQLTGEKSIKDKRIDYVFRSDPAQYFFDKFLEHDVNAPNIPKSVLYDSYVKFCHSIDKIPIADSTLAKKLKRLVSYAGESRTHDNDKRVTVWTGIGFDFALFEAEITGQGGQGSQGYSNIVDLQEKL